MFVLGTTFVACCVEHGHSTSQLHCVCGDESHKSAYEYLSGSLLKIYGQGQVQYKMSITNNDDDVCDWQIADPLLNYNMHETFSEFITSHQWLHLLLGMIGDQRYGAAKFTATAPPEPSRHSPDESSRRSPQTRLS
ncbi:uncharacterized protein FOMMEDRAFT_25148 [Fomitiporia mediterranea MF3/22]|uniref:uncharacterized protein n=1 Tax=Fomitiporia mediterranea (strain MF3/22) TaxID=694068 RepID=UPI00044084A4|nr:uncharacterized protein FOMMEDRAFT_25148 [Fomitiporia mediterranea MF3/22]EJD07904.1 hypothetical protein FOMMEDRAFT_25148 [Fomitiporia mediterranea MF3/22]